MDSEEFRHHTSVEWARQSDSIGQRQTWFSNCRLRAEMLDIPPWADGSCAIAST